MVKQRKTKISELNELSLVIAGCLLIAVIGLVMVPRMHKTSPEKSLSDIEVREKMARAADDYMLAETTVERQAAARKIKSLRSDNSASRSPAPEQAVLILRIVLIVTIVLLFYKLIQLLLMVRKLREASRPQES